ncbi:MAG: hypothetical protein JWR80_3313, partial [Bradyrhizobium sp.]|nr:hypothetical protein [Bradyrhizobium sp.]
MKRPLNSSAAAVAIVTLLVAAPSAARQVSTTNEVAQLNAAVSAAFSELQRERERAEALASELAKVRREAGAAATVSSQKGDDAVQQKQTAEGTIADLRLLLQLEKEKTTALTQAVNAARQAMTANVEPQRRVLDEAPARAAALAGEPAGTRRAIETPAAQSQKAVDEAVQQKQAAAGAIADLQQLLQQEQKKTAALAQEVGAARQAMTNAEQQRRALDEAQSLAAALAGELAGTRRALETQAAQSQKAVDEAAQQKQTAEGAIADLQKLPRQNRDRTEAMARAFATVPRTMDRRVAAEPAVDNLVHVTPVVKTAVTESLKGAEAQGSAETTKLIVRASVLLGQGNIGAARIVLERAAESGNAQASFMLAET